MAPDFSFQTIEGKTVILSSLRGQPVIISFVLTVGCVPCKAEALNIQTVRKQIPNFKVIQLAINHRETADDLRNFRDSFGDPDWLIGFDNDLKIAELYAVRAVDTTILINADGRVIYRDDGYPIETRTLIEKLSSQP